MLQLPPVSPTLFYTVQFNNFDDNGQTRLMLYLQFNLSTYARQCSNQSMNVDEKQILANCLCIIYVDTF